MTFGDLFARLLRLGSAGQTKIQPGAGSPEGAVDGAVGDLFLRTDGGAATSLYVKESGSSDTGWAAVGGAAAGTVTTTGSPANGNLTKFSGASTVTNANLSGDVTTSGSVATTIANSAVTLAKMADIATDRLIGRDSASTGVPEALTVGGGVEFTGSGGIQRSALTGDVTATAGSASTTIANDAVTYAKMQNVSAAARILGRGSAAGSGDPEEITLGAGMSLAGTVLSSTAVGTGGGDVVGPGSSVDSEIVLFDSTTGQLVKSATGTGVVHATSGVYSTGDVDLTSEVTGVLPIANIATGTPDGTQFVRDDGTLAVPAGGGGDCIKLDEQTPSGSGTLTFTVPGGYTHLQIRFSARSTKAAVASEDMGLRFNADTGGNYDRELIYGSGTTTASTDEALAQTSGLIASLPAATATANVAAGGVIDIYDYLGTTFQKNATAQNLFKFGTSTGELNVRVWAVAWRSTAAITSITLFLSSGNFVAGSKFSLYGLT